MIMSKIQEIEEKCKENGLNIYKVFSKAEVHINTIANWKRKEPDAFGVYDKINETIDLMVLEKNEVNSKTTS